MKKDFTNTKFTVITEKGQQFLIDKEGRTVPAQIWTRVDDVVLEPTTVIVKMEVNLVGSREEAIKLYEK